MSTTSSSVPPSQAPIPVTTNPVAQTQPVTVRTPSGHSISVLGPEEEAFYNSLAAQYQRENAFSNAADLLDLDRLLFLELQSYRMNRWLGQGAYDYDHRTVDEQQCQRILKETSNMISQTKADLGLTKAARDKSRQEDAGQYIVELLQRAKEFGIVREEQAVAAIKLMKQLFSVVGSFDRSDKIEREKLGFADEAAIIDWIRDTMKPEFDQIDQSFINRPDGQRYWVRQV